MSITFKDVITKNLGIRKLKTEINEIFNDLKNHSSASITQAEYDKFIKVVTKGTTLSGLNISQLISLFNIYLPTNAQLTLLLDKIDTIGNYNHTNYINLQTY